MAQQDQKRERLFKKFSEQLRLLQRLNMLPSYMELSFERTYICPICTKPFSETDLSTSSPNMLTLEDAPPDSLGGHKIALTCKKCNNTCGYKIDNHLSRAMIEADQKSFLPGAEIDMHFLKDGEKVNGQLTVGQNGLGKVIHRINQNNPTTLGKYIAQTKEHRSVGVHFKNSLVDGRRLGIALLKTAYIMTFAKFGYTLLMRSNYDNIRTQLLNPDKSIYPLNFWTSKPFSPEHEGVHLLLNEGSEGFFSIFPLHTKLETRRFGVYIPIPGIQLNDALHSLDQRNGLELHFDPAHGDFIRDEGRIKEIDKWCRSIIMHSLGKSRLK